MHKKEVDKKLLRTIVYVDGFNLFYGIRAFKKPSYRWLDLNKLVSNITDDSHEIVKIKYFTSTIKVLNDDLSSFNRQQTYLDALKTMENIDIQYGKFLKKEHSCKSCSKICKEYICYKCGESNNYLIEKATDVNIACQIISDIYEDNFDIAILISGDTDLITPVHRVVKAGKQIMVVFPPKRTNLHLQKIAHKSLTLNEKIISKSLLPEEISTKRSNLHCPDKWKKKAFKK